MPPALLGMGLELWSGEERLGGIEDLDLFVNDDPTGTLRDVQGPHNDRLRIVGVFNDRAEDERRLVWNAEIDPHGGIAADTELDVVRGYSRREELSSVLERFPPTVYFLDGTTTIGSLRYDSRSVTRGFDLRLLETFAWTNVDITAETRRKAAERGEGKISVHERLERYLIERPRLGVKRWILCNDGSGEIADYVVIEELDTGAVALGLWHAKYAHGAAPSVRIGDFQEVVAQALRSRASLASTGLWNQIRQRILGEEKPTATLIHGSNDERELLSLLRIEDVDAEPVPWTRRYPVVSGTIGVVQPGLSAGRLVAELAETPQPPGAVALEELFTVLADTAVSDGTEIVILVSE
jgi:hypothetical protein